MSKQNIQLILISLPTNELSQVRLLMGSAGIIRHLLRILQKVGADFISGISTDMTY